MAHPVTWFQIQGSDAKGLQDFYRTVFGWKMSLAPDGSGMAMVQAEKKGIAGGIGAPMDGSGKNSVSVYVDTDNLERQLEAIANAGGTPAMQPMDLPPGMGRIAGFVDPAGNWIGLWQPGKPVRAPRAKRAAKRGAAKAAKKGAAKKGAAKKAPAKKAAKKAPAKKAAKKS